MFLVVDVVLHGESNGRWCVVIMILLGPFSQARASAPEK
jgi:hypothetical protein